MKWIFFYLGALNTAIACIATPPLVVGLNAAGAFMCLANLVFLRDE